MVAAEPGVQACLFLGRWPRSQLPCVCAVQAGVVGLCMELGTARQLELETREQALQVVSWIARWVAVEGGQGGTGGTWCAAGVHVSLGVQVTYNRHLEYKS